MRARYFVPDLRASLSYLSPMQSRDGHNQARRAPDDATGTVRLRAAILSLLVTICLTYAGACHNAARADAYDDIEKSIEEFRNRTIYRELNPEILASIPDDMLEQAVIDYVVVKIGNQYDREKAI